MKWIIWNSSKDSRKFMPIRWRWRPISVGWQRNSCRALICWHGWSIHGPIDPAATRKDYGWTLHIGALKIYFGRRCAEKRIQDTIRNAEVSRER